jgi:DNA-directed RNA polymerase specialized sigma24 family protein
LRENRRSTRDDPAEFADLSTDALSADERALRIIRLKRVRDALMQLSEKDRLAVLLWNLRVAPEELSSKLGSSYGAARKRVCLAVQRLRSIIAKGEKH